MARELITIHVGETGVQIAPEFWKKLCEEHGLDNFGQVKSQPKGNVTNFFHKVDSGKFVPRAILVDLGPSAIRYVSNTIMPRFFDPKKSVIGYKSDGNNFARGFYTHGVEILESIIERIETEITQTENLQGFIFVHSLGDGTGSGLSTLIMKKLKEIHSTIPILSYSIIPSEYFGGSSVLPYNIILSLDKLIDHADVSILIDNDKIYRLIANHEDVDKINESIFNRILGNNLGDITSTLRFNSILNRTVMEIQTNLIPFPRSHFLITSLCPLDAELTSNHSKIKTEEIVRSLVDDNFLFASINLSKGVFSGIVMILRGENPKSTILNTLKTLDNIIKFNPIFPTAIKADSTVMGSETLTRSGVSLMNHSQVASLFQKFLLQFDLMFEKDAFLSWYLDEGMQKEDFLKARENVEKIIGEYRQDEQ